MHQVAVSNIIDKMEILEITYMSMTNVKQSVAHFTWNARLNLHKAWRTLKMAIMGMLISLIVVIIS